MKRIMILGASVGQLPIIKKVKELGYELAVVDFNPEAVGIPYADVFYNVSTTDIKAVVDAAKDYRPDGITTVQTDMPMRAIAAACKELCLVGITPDTAFRATDKEAMIKAFKQGGVSSPWYNVFSIADRCETIDCKISYPCIVKPVDNSASRGVTLVSNKDELFKAIEYARKESGNGRIIIEEYMVGPEISVEIIMLNGNAHVIAVTDKLTTGAPHFVEMGHSEQSMIDVETIKQIEALAAKAMLAVGVMNGPGHVEMIVTQSGPQIVELGARLGGDFITTDLVPLSTGVDMLKAVIDIACGDQPDIVPKFNKGSAIRFVSSENGRVIEIEGIEEAKKLNGVIKVECLKCVGDVVPPLNSSLDRVGYVIAQAETTDKAVDICEKAMKKIRYIIDRG